MRPLFANALIFSSIAAAAATAILACAPKPSGESLRSVGPSVPDFTDNCQVLEGGTAQSCGVSAMIERRCGSIDCHGFIRRPMRVYSKYGLRLPPLDPTSEAGINEPGGADTTPEEKSANYRAVIGIEPEKTDDVNRGLAAPETLLIYKKPLGLEHHKGGVPINKGDDSERCLVSWLKGQTDKIACGSAAQLP